MVRKLSDWRIPINEGPFDRAMRIVAGLAILSLMFVGPESLWGLLGFIPLITGVVGYCPLYGLFHVSTVGRPHRVRHA